MKSKFYLPIAALLLSFCAKAQTKKFNWSHEFAVCSGEYNSKKYTEIQLRNTIDYLWYSQSINAKYHAWQPEEIDNLDIEGIDSDYKRILNNLTTKEFVETPFWKEVKAKRIKELKALYMLKKLTAMAYSKPELLKSFQVFSDVCDTYINALTQGGDLLLAEWENLIVLLKKQNGNPQRLQEEFETKITSPKKLEFARIDLMLYGFWNNALDIIPHFDSNMDFENEFKKLFKNVICEYEAP